MATDSQGSIFTLNSGSASLAFAVYETRASAPFLFKGKAKRVQLENGHLTACDAEGKVLLDEDREFPDYETAYQAVFDALRKHGYHTQVQIVGHRVVHGGTDRFDPQPGDDAVLGAQRQLVSLVPKHLGTLCDVLGGLCWSSLAA